MAYEKQNFIDSQTLKAEHLNHIEDGIANIVNIVYPVGSIYMSINSASPDTLFGGTWEQLKDRFLLAAGDSYGVGSTGGEANHALIQNEIPNYKIGFIPSAVPAYHGEWQNEGVYSADMSTGSRQDTIKDTATSPDTTQYGWNIYTNGGGAAHNNMPPYLAVYMWRRTA